MTLRALLALALLVAVAGLAVPALAEEHDEASDDGPSGEELSAFLQTTESEMDAAVSDGVFRARVDRADDEAERRAVVEERLAELETRADRVEARMDALERAEGQGSAAHRAKVAGAAAQLAALNRSLSATEERADETGVDSERLAELRERADELSGHEVARQARSLAGPNGSVPGGPGPVDPGPGDERGPDDDPGEDRGAAGERGNSTGDGAPEDTPGRDAPPEDPPTDDTPAEDGTGVSDLGPGKSPVEAAGERGDGDDEPTPGNGDGA